MLKPNALLPETSESQAPVRYSYVMVHQVGSARYQADGHLAGTAYLLPEAHGNDTLVTMTSGHFITNRDFSLLSNVNADRLVNTR